MARVPEPIEALGAVQPEATPRVGIQQMRLDVPPFNRVAMAVQQLGGDITKAGDQVFNEAINVQNQYNQSQARDITNTTQSQMAQNLEKFRALGPESGEPGALSKFLNDQQTFYNQTRDSIKNPVQRRFFENDIAFYMRHGVSEASAISNQQRVANIKQTHDATKALAAAAAGTNPNNDALVQQGADTTRQASIDELNTNHIDPNSPRGLYQVAKDQSTYWLQQITSLSQPGPRGNPAKAYQMEQTAEAQGLLIGTDQTQARERAFEGVTHWAYSTALDNLKAGKPARDPAFANPLEHAHVGADGGTGVGMGIIPANLRTNDVQTAINSVAQAHNIHPGAIAAMIGEESSWNPQAGMRGEGGPLGLWQVVESQNPTEAMAIRAAKNEPAQQISIYNEWLNRNGFDQRLKEAGVNFSNLTVAQQAAYLEAFQLNPKDGINNIAAGGNAVDIKVTPQARNLGDTSLADMTKAFQATIGKEEATPTSTAPKAPTAPLPPIVAKSQAPEDIKEALLAQAERDAPGNVQVKNAALKVWEEDQAMTERAARVADFNNKQIMYDANEQALAKGVRALTPEELAQNSKDPAAVMRVFQSMEPTTRDEFRKRLLENRNSPSTASPDQINDYNRMRTLAIEHPDQFQNVNPYTLKLPVEWQQELFKTQLDIRKGQMAYPDLNRALTRLKPYLEQSDINLTSQSPEWPMFVSLLQGRMDEYRQRTGKDMDPQDIDKVGRELTTIVSKPSTGILAGITKAFVGDTRFYDQDPPQADADKIRGQLQARGEEASDFNIKRYYLNQLYRAAVEKAATGLRRQQAQAAEARAIEEGTLGP